MHPDWKYLPKHILDSILQKLKLPSDHLRFSVVCKSWHCVANHSRIQRAKMMSSCHHPPMLLIPSDKEDTWNLYNVMKNIVLDLQVTVPSNYRRFCGSSKGWLIAMDENFVIALINPFLRVKGREKENSIIHLPPLVPPMDIARYIWHKNYEEFLTNATISADPILCADDCIVVVTYMPLCQSAFIRLNKDTTWTYIGERIRGSYGMIQEVVYVEDKFYAVDLWSKLLSFDITNQFNSNVKVAASGFEISGPYFDSYLVYTNEKELLMVQRFIDFQGDKCDKRKTKKFRVFGLDFDKFEWIEKNTLGGITLFLGDNSSTAVLASKIPGCKPDRIYFNHDNDPINNRVNPRDFGVYNFKTQKFRLPYNTRAKNLLKTCKRYQYPIWILPTFQL
ncbi:hypothetical protein M0R45_038008 [Rubus argutus]|uniref:F-box domain-containing protein n=1 Tax=Rubus argutus TaxID=59490 RepID=A0AAW1W405_RUBAR